MKHPNITRQIDAGFDGDIPWIAMEYATDVWALGMLAFYCLTGRLYWVEDDNPEVGFHPPRVSEPASVRAAKISPGIALPPGFDRWFGRCTAVNPLDRFADAQAAFSAMEVWGIDPEAPTDSHPKGVAGRRTTTLALGAAVVAGIAAIAWARSSSVTPIERQASVTPDRVCLREFHGSPGSSLRGSAECSSLGRALIVKPSAFEPQDDGMARARRGAGSRRVQGTPASRRER